MRYRSFKYTIRISVFFFTPPLMMVPSPSLWSLWQDRFLIRKWRLNDVTWRLNGVIICPFFLEGSSINDVHFPRFALHPLSSSPIIFLWLNYGVSRLVKPPPPKIGRHLWTVLSEKYKVAPYKKCSITNKFYTYFQPVLFVCKIIDIAWFWYNMTVGGLS